jgi:aspartate-semialdehyde dehydrogenase
MQLSGNLPARCSAARPKAAGRRQALQVYAAKTSNGPRVAVVGVTGAVGQEFLTVREAPPGYISSLQPAVAAT